MLMLFVVASIPELMATVLSPEGMRFTGALVNLDDLNTYLSAIRQGAEGHWLFTPTFVITSYSIHYTKLYDIRQWFVETGLALAEMGYQIDTRKKMLKSGFLTWKYPSLTWE